MRCELSQIEGTHYLRQTNSHSEYAVQAIDFLWYAFTLPQSKLKK